MSGGAAANPGVRAPRMLLLPFLDFVCARIGEDDAPERPFGERLRQWSRDFKARH